MARNAEKANLMLNKWSALKSSDTAASLGLDKGGGREKRRPFLASECKALPECEKWRLDVVRDVARRMSDVQNAGLGEARLRDLNDEINKLLREKGHWERQIKALGGPDHARAAASAAAAGGAAGWELPGARGYKYFGAARDLPGVKELFADAAAAASGGAGGAGGDFGGFGARRRGDVLRGLTPDYFGFRDEDDGVLLPLEARRSAELRAEAHAAWEAAGGEEGARRRLRAEVGGAGAGGGAAARDEAAAPAAPAITAAAAADMIAARRRALLAAAYEEAPAAAAAVAAGSAAPAPAAGAAAAAASTTRLIDYDE